MISFIVSNKRDQVKGVQASAIFFIHPVGFLSSATLAMICVACVQHRQRPQISALRLSPLPATLGGPLRSSHHQLACYHILSHNKHVISALVIVECVLVSLRHVLAWNWPENWPLSIILNTFVIGGEKPIDTLRGFSALWPRRVAIHIIHSPHEAHLHNAHIKLHYH